jgi:two-component system KDP operon response regulator KdpE
VQILVLDKHQDEIEALRVNLSVRGYDVLAAATGGQCVELASREKPGLVLLECQSPKQAGGDDDGIDALRRIRRISSVPVIMHSACASASDRADGLKMGADDYLTHPYSVDELVARMQAILRRAGKAPPSARWAG